MTSLAVNWTKLADGPWAAREGLMAVATPGGIVMTGGRKLFGAVATNVAEWRSGLRSALLPPGKTLRKQTLAIAKHIAE